MTLALAALGVVQGDMGASPLYAVKECFHGPHAIPLLHVNIMGVLSLIVWSLTIIVSVKYVMFVLRADNKGEGGVALLVLFLFFELSFPESNLLKILDGVWFTLTVATLIMTCLLTWRDGKKGLGKQFAAIGLPINLFLESLVALDRPIRIPGTAVFMSVSATGTPLTLLHHYKHIKRLHEQIVQPSITSAEMPYVTNASWLEVPSLGHGFFRIIARYGFMQTLNVPGILRLARTTALTSTFSAPLSSWGVRPCSRADPRRWPPGARRCMRTCRATPGMPRLCLAFRRGGWLICEAKWISRISALTSPAGGFQTPAGRI